MAGGAHPRAVSDVHTAVNAHGMGYSYQVR